MKSRLLHVCALVPLGLALWAGVYVLQAPPYLGLEILANGNVHEVAGNGPAAEAGIERGDRITAVDGGPVHRRMSITGGKPAGEVVELTVSRGSESLVIPVITRPEPRRQLVFNLERFAVGLVFWLVGLGLWLSRPQEPATRIFLALSVAGSCLLFAEVLTPAVPAFSIFANTSRYLLAPLILHFFCVFPRPLEGRWRTSLLGAAYGGYALTVVTFAGAMVLGLNFFEPPLSRVGGMFVRFEVFVLILALVVLLRPHPDQQLLTHRRRRLLLAGMMTGLSPIVLTLASKAISGGQPIIAYEWTLPLLAILPVTFAYAVYHGELGKADFILNRSVVYLLLSAVLLSGYAISFVLVNMAFSERQASGHLLLGLAVIGGSALFVPLRTRLQRLVDHLFFGGWYDYRSFVRALSQDLSRSTDLDDLAAQLKVAGERMRFQAGVLLWPKDDAFVPRAAFGYDMRHLRQLHLSSRSPIVQLLTDTAIPYLNQSVRAALSFTDLTSRERSVLICDDHRCWLPLVSRGSLRGILLAGRRHGDESLDNDDFAILETLSTQAAVACENIALLESLKERLTEVEKVRDELAEAKARLAEGREDERLHLARELHDGPVQDLCAAMHSVARLGTAAPSAGEDLVSVRDTLQRVAGALRDVCTELRPPLLADFGLDMAIRSWADQLQRTQPGVALELVLTSYQQALPPRVELALFRICQEALNNAVNHGRCTAALVRLEVDAEGIILEIMDNGCGFIVPGRWIELGRRGHLGLLGIAERVELLGGTLTVRSQPGHGTRLLVEAPPPVEAGHPDPSPNGVVVHGID
jgi:signal transduction histidine kinase